MEVVNISYEHLGYSLKPTLYSVKLKETDSKTKMVVLLETNGQSRDISTWQDVKTQRPLLRFKILSFGQVVTTLYKEVQVNSGIVKVQIESDVWFSFQCVEINSVKDCSAGKLFRLTQTESQGLQKFKEFRKKVKKLQNLTSNLNWKTSCRLKLFQGKEVTSMEIDGGKEMVVDLGSGPLRVVLEQIAWLNSPDDFMTQVLSDSLINPVQSTLVVFKYTQYLTLKIRLQRLASKVCVPGSLMSLRVLETSYRCDQLRVFKDSSISMGTIQALFSEPQSDYYDVEYFHLLKNLEQVQSNSSRQSSNSTTNFQVFKQLRQLTPAFPNYPHLKNQMLFPITPQSQLTFYEGTEFYLLKVFELMEGLNSIQTPKGNIRFYIEILQQSLQAQTSQVRLLTVKVADLWNVYDLPTPLTVKILNNQNTYSLNLVSTPKQLKNMLYQNEFYKGNQVTVRESSKTTIVTKAQQYNFTDIPQKQFYLQETLQGESIRIQLSHHDDILYAGTCDLKNLTSNSVIVPLESLAGSLAYSFIRLDCKHIPRADNSVKSLYKIASSISSPITVSSLYELTVTNISTSKTQKKKLRVTKQNLLQDTEFCVISDTDECQLLVLLRRHCFDQATSEMTSIQLYRKNLHLNKTHSPMSGDVVLRIPPNHYQMVMEPLNDQQYGQLHLALQLTHIKQEFLDRHNDLYSMKIPKQFWQNLKQTFKNVNSVTFQVMSCKKQKSKSKGSRTKQLSYMDSSQFCMPQTDYRDSMAVTINNSEAGFCKIHNMVTLKIQHPDQEIVFDQDGEWNLGIINVKESMLMFIYAFKESAEESDRQSVRTVSKSKEKNKMEQSISMNATIKVGDAIGVKRHINSLVQENRMLVTKAVRLESNNTILYQRLKELEDIASRQKVELKFTHKAKPSPEQVRNMNKYRSMCSCGATGSLHGGYCEECLGQLQKTYSQVFKLFSEKAAQYQKVYFQKVLKKEKLSKLERKLETLKGRLLMRQSGDNWDPAECEYQGISEDISNTKNQIFVNNLRTKNTIESSAVLQLSLETRINQSARSVFSMMQQIQDFRLKTKRIDALIHASK